MYKEDNMNNTMTIKQFAFENGIKPRTLPTRLRLAAKKGCEIYPVGKEGKAHLYTRNDLTKANDFVAKNKTTAVIKTRTKNKKSFDKRDATKSILLQSKHLDEQFYEILIDAMLDYMVKK